MTELWQVIIAALGGGTLTALITLWANRRKTGAETEQISAQATQITAQTTQVFIDSTKELISEYRQRSNELQGEIEQLRGKIKLMEKELEVQAIHIENTNGKNAKLQLVVFMITVQLREIGIEPCIETENIESIKLDDLRLMAQSMHNIGQRRRNAETVRFDGAESQ